MSVCPSPAPFQKKNCVHEIFIKGKDLSSQTFQNNRPIGVHVFTLFCLIKRSLYLKNNVLITYLIYFIQNEYISITSFTCNLCNIR